MFCRQNLLRRKGAVDLPEPQLHISHFSYQRPYLEEDDVVDEDDVNDDDDHQHRHNFCLSIYLSFVDTVPRDHVRRDTHSFL